MKEYYIKGLESLNDKIESLRQIDFCLNDYQEGLEKTYYFTFEVVNDGYLCFYASVEGDIQLFIEDAPVCLDKEFFLKKGVYQARVVSLLDYAQTLKISIFGRVKYYSNSQVKVANLNAFSVVAVIEQNLSSLYKYDDGIEVIDVIETNSLDLCESMNEAVVFYTTDGGFEKRTYLQDLSCITESFSVSNLTQIRCYGGSEMGLYGVKDGFLCRIDATTGEINTLNLKVKNLLAVSVSAVVFRDFDDKIKLCNFSVSP